jgi:thiamine pyrophosphate-dependent acetolactate synthase large subunit-like protein
MAKKTASDILIETLIDRGFEQVFGIPCNGINGNVTTVTEDGIWELV